MAIGVLVVADLWRSVHDNNDVFHDSHVRWQIARGHVLRDTRSLLGKFDTLCILNASTGTSMKEYVISDFIMSK